jgi:uroporphyrin-III C-methyltransferase
MTTKETEKDDNTSENDVDAHQAPTAQNKKPPLILLLVLIGLALSVFAIFFTAKTFIEIESIKQTSSNDERFLLYNSSLDQVNKSISVIQAQQEGMKGSIDSLVISQDSNSQSLKTLFESQNNDELSWSLKEVEYLINIARLRISLEQDVGTALIAMEAAEKRLASFGDPGLYDTRRQLNAEINELRDIKTVDIVGLSLMLTNMASRVNSLPLKAAAVLDYRGEKLLPDNNLPVWKQFLFNIWQEFKGMFTITRTGEYASATLLPDEQYFLYQNLRLQLEAARLAVLRRDTTGMQDSMRVIKTWLNEYFDLQDLRLENIIREIESINGVVLNPALPVIGSSLDALSLYINNRNSVGLDPGNEIP